MRIRIHAPSTTSWFVCAVTLKTILLSLFFSRLCAALAIVSCPAWLVSPPIAPHNTFSPLPVLDAIGRLPDSSMLSLLWVRRQSRYIFPRRKISPGRHARRLYQAHPFSPPPFSPQGVELASPLLLSCPRSLRML